MEKISQVGNILDSEFTRQHDIYLIAQQVKFHTASLKSKTYTFSWLCKKLKESTSTINSTIKRATVLEECTNKTSTELIYFTDNKLESLWKLCNKMQKSKQNEEKEQMNALLDKNHCQLKQTDSQSTDNTELEQASFRVAKKSIHDELSIITNDKTVSVSRKISRVENMHSIAQSWNQHANLFKKMNNNYDIDLSTPSTETANNLKKKLFDFQNDNKSVAHTKK